MTESEIETSNEHLGAALKQFDDAVESLAATIFDHATKARLRNERDEIAETVCRAVMYDSRTYPDAIASVEVTTLGILATIEERSAMLAAKLQATPSGTAH